MFGIRVVNVYGLTETVCEACYCGPDEASFRLGTVGKPVDCEARVLDADGLELPVEAEGELALRGDNVMSGYFRMPKETAAVLRDGWFLTGDLAKIDGDGFVHIVGRKKSVVVTGGHNVYPEDVNNILRSINGVLDAVTFGLDDETWGEKVVSCVVPAKDTTLTVEYLATEILKRASKEKLPRDIHIVDELPRGPAGKVIIAEAKELAMTMQNRMDCGDMSDVDSTILKIAAEVFKTPIGELSQDSGPSNTAGWNSLAHVEFLLAIERAYSLRLDAKDIMNMISLHQTMRVIKKRLQE
jgi:long-chain acyl-CoA synthetase